MKNAKHYSSAGQAGFTLIEILVALLLTSLIMTSVFGVLHDALTARDHIHNVSQTQRTGPMILDMIEGDLKSIAPFNLGARKVLLGRKNSIGGSDADTIDFVITRSATNDFQVADGVLGKDRSVHAPLCEVGYRLRRNSREPVFLELWRREDPLVDEDPFTGGVYTKIYDKITNFRITYFPEVGSQSRAEDSWSTEETGVLPQRIHIEMQLEIEPRVESADRPLDFSRRRSFSRTFNLDPDINRVLASWLRPRLPETPKDDTQPGGAPGGGPGGGPGKGGPGQTFNINGGGFPGAGGGKPSGLPGVFNNNGGNKGGNPFGGNKPGAGNPFGGGKTGGGALPGGFPGGGGGGKK